MAAGCVTASGVVGGRAVAAEADLPVVWRWKDCSPESLLQALARVRGSLSGKVAVKLHSGEPHEPSIIPPARMKQLVAAAPQSSPPTSRPYSGILAVQLLTASRRQLCFARSVQRQGK